MSLVIFAWTATFMQQMKEVVGLYNVKDGMLLSCAGLTYHHEQGQ
jgi:hypothetical protein